MNKLDLLQGLKCIAFLLCDLFGLYTTLAFTIGFGGVLTFRFLFFFVCVLFWTTGGYSDVYVCFMIADVYVSLLYLGT
jgi:hypothetical protein